jgi:hypothetical protein
MLCSGAGVVKRQRRQQHSSGGAGAGAGAGGEVVLKKRPDWTRSSGCEQPFPRSSQVYAVVPSFRDASC